MEYVNLKNTVTVGYIEIEPEPADTKSNSKHTLTAKPPRQVDLSDPMSGESEPCTTYQNMYQHSDPPSATNDIYTVPDTTRSQLKPTVENM